MFQRKIKFVIEFSDGSSLEYDERYDISFSVVKFFSVALDGLNTAEVRIANLSNESRKRIEKTAGAKVDETSKPSVLKIYAGYDSYNLVFRGQIQNVEQQKLDVDINTVIYCYDNTINKQIHKSVQNQKLSDFIREISDFEVSIDIPNRNIVNQAYSGNLQTILEELSKEFGFNYYVDDNKLFITENIKPLQITKTVSRKNGLLGIPEINSTGCSIDIILDPSLSIGDFIRLDSKFGNFNIGDKTFIRGRLQGTDFNAFNRKFSELDGEYYIRQINHVGETRGDIFKSSLTCLYPTVKV